MTSKRPDMRAYFAARIGSITFGMMSRAYVTLPRDVVKIKGDVTDSLITVTMHDGSQFYWQGGRYAARKVNLCYAPLMPKPTAPPHSST